MRYQRTISEGSTIFDNDISEIVLNAEYTGGSPAKPTGREVEKEPTAGQTNPVGRLFEPSTTKGFHQMEPTINGMEF